MTTGKLALAYALVLAASNAFAGDAVVADDPLAPAPEKARACDEYGTGFVMLPGTSTCVRVSGELSYQKNFSSSSDKPKSGDH